MKQLNIKHLVDPSTQSCLQKHEHYWSIELIHCISTWSTSILMKCASK